MKTFAVILTILLFAAIAYFFYKIKDKNFKRNVFIVLFFLKILGGFSVYAVYTYLYDPSMADIHKFFRGGKVLYQAADENFTDYLRLITGIQGKQSHLQKYYDQTDYWTREFSYGLFNDNRTIMRFNAIVCLFSAGNVYIHILVMAFLSFLGCFVLYKSFDEIFPELNPYLKIISAFLVPSCLFWTSGLLKEGLLMFAIGFTMWFAIKLYKKFNIFTLIGFIASAALMFTSKVYVLPAFLPALFFLFVSKKFNLKQQIILFFAIIVFSAIFVIFSGKIIGYDILHTLSGKQNDFINYISLLEDKGSTFELPRLSPNLESFVKLVPIGFINSMFRPFPGEVRTVFLLFSFAEIVLFVIFILLSVVFFKKPRNHNEWRVILFCLTFVLFLNVLVGVYTPNTGSIVRYRTPGLPFQYLMLFILIDWKRLRTFANDKLKLKKVNI
ncbi:MAG TPA: hypothetical protein P5538_08900 [Bacteroidales bacterium]|jgi:hypothetical protein|nr:hypothetical protein [Bacteroidales bacterium]HPD24794.1 hypothetical protein [Bacteroidales bacterium]HRT00571.1 hypothetical protein [Bacteroidales bacterium]HRT81041.1 hypothetical protein [Bacteroidales bacterium]